jgi:hypothetical protein
LCSINIEATDKLIAYRGSESLTMEHVAQAIEISKGAIDLYFRNKDGMKAMLQKSLFGPTPSFEFHCDEQAIVITCSFSRSSYTRSCVIPFHPGGWRVA